eukprot:COSAG01_NODE_1454_length_10256_cov_4.300748_5_plen_105_part_00
MTSWCKGYPEICPSSQCQTPLNPATNKTYELLDDLFEDLTGGTRGSGLFPDNVVSINRSLARTSVALCVCAVDMGSCRGTRAPHALGECHQAPDGQSAPVQILV